MQLHLLQVTDWSGTSRPLALSRYQLSTVSTRSEIETSPRKYIPRLSFSFRIEPGHRRRNLAGLAAICSAPTLMITKCFVVRDAVGGSNIGRHSARSPTFPINRVLPRSHDHMVIEVMAYVMTTMTMVMTIWEISQMVQPLIP